MGEREKVSWVEGNRRRTYFERDKIFSSFVARQKHRSELSVAQLLTQLEITLAHLMAHRRYVRISVVKEY